MFKRVKMNKVWWGVAVLTCLLILGSLYTSSVARVTEGNHNGNLGFWEQTEPHPSGWDCWVWVNKGDHDVSLLWCDVPAQNQSNFRN